jgi:hypothetical protein
MRDHKTLQSTSEGTKNRINLTLALRFSENGKAACKDELTLKFGF